MSATATVSDPNRKHLEAARTLIAKGDLKQAALTLNKAQKQLPNDPRVFMLAGLMAEKSGNINGAFEALRRSVAMAPDWALACWNWPCCSPARTNSRKLSRPPKKWLPWSLATCRCWRV